MLVAPEQASSPRFLQLCSPNIHKLPDTSTNHYAVSAFKQHFKQEIMAQTSLMQSVSFGNSNTNCGNISTNFNTFNLSDEDARILRWLSPLEPNNRHQGVRTERFDGVGEWLLEKREFREWRGSEDGAGRGILFCSGDPGVGKTYLRQVE